MRELEHATSAGVLSARSVPSARRHLIGVVVLALTLRLVVAFFAFHAVARPSLDHNEFGVEMGWTARSLALGQGFSSPFFPATGPTALVPPIYPYLLAEIFRTFGLYSAWSAFGILALNSLFSALTCLPIYFTVLRSLDSRLAGYAALAWAVYPFSIYFSAGVVWDYALTAFLFTLCFCAIQRLAGRAPGMWFAFGLLAGITVLSNPSTGLVILVLLLGPGRRQWRNALLALVTMLAVCAPWCIRNERTLGTGAMLRDGLWLEFYAGNNGDTFESNTAAVHPASNPAELRLYQRLGEVAYMEQKRGLALNFARQDPGFVVRATLRRFVRFWTGFWSVNRRYLAKETLDIPNVPFCTALTIVMLFGLRRWWRVDRRAVAPYLLPCFCFRFRTI